MQKDRLYSWLEEGKGTAREVKADILDRPAFTTLPLPVKIDLGYVLDKCDGGLRITHHQECINFVFQWMSKDLNAPINEDSDIAADQEDNPELVDVTLLSSIIDKDLGELDGWESESM